MASTRPGTTHGALGMGLEKSGKLLPISKLDVEHLNEHSGREEMSQKGGTEHTSLFNTKQENFAQSQVLLGIRSSGFHVLATEHNFAK